ncbi:hypothetical protein V1477_000021 [Vespula maculifrons]|uniref:Uncharacterized protein n=1 Tax=Vespula maculifrons TaxID=7453 RepID=A0ABD2D2Z6_VESMC
MATRDVNKMESLIDFDSYASSLPFKNNCTLISYISLIIYTIYFLLNLHFELAVMATRDVNKMESLIDFDSYASSLPLYFDESTSKDRQDIFSVSNNKNYASSLPLYFDESTSKDPQDIFSVSNNKK